MLAEYHPIIDYDFSPIQSPLFAENDQLLSCSQDNDVEITLPLSIGLDHPPLLPDLEDDVSSISPSVQCSETLEEDDLPYQLIDSTNPHAVIGQTVSQDSSIQSQGLDGDAELDGLFERIEYLNSSCLDPMQEPVPLDVHVPLPTEDDVCFVGTEEDPEDLNCNGSEVIDQHGSSACSSPRQRKRKTEEKGWNDMDVIEKEEVAEHLSSVLQSLLGPRERLEVMSMISQDQLDEKDIVIESHMLSESTLAKLETYLEQQELTGEASDSELISEPERKRSYGNKTKRKCSSLPASPHHTTSYSERSPSLGVKKRSNQRKPLRSWRRRTRKEYRQASKERRSGLFIQEEVISLSRTIGDEEEDTVEEEIDILA